MGLLFTIPAEYSCTSAGGSTDLFTMLAGDDQVLVLEDFILGQKNQIQEAEEDSVYLEVVRLGATASVGSGGSAFTTANAGRVERQAGALASGTFRYNDATLATSSGTTEIIASLAWNVRNNPISLRAILGDALLADIIQTEGLVIRLVDGFVANTAIAQTAVMRVSGKL